MPSRWQLPAVTWPGTRRECSTRPGAELSADWVRSIYIVMVKFLLWCILLILCWPLALAALVLYPVVWLLLLPFRLVGFAIHGVLEFVAAIILLPARVIRAIA